MCANDFLWACYYTLRNPLQEFAWYPKDYKIKHTFCSIRARLINSEKQKMKIHQGNTRVVAESDGGLTIYPTPGYKCHYPVLIIEVINSLILDADVSLNG